MTPPSAETPPTQVTSLKIGSPRSVNRGFGERQPQWRATLASAGLVAALEGAERFALPPPPAIASVGTQEPMVRRLFPGGESQERTRLGN